jgi:outer membrane protein assembly factor BamB
LPHKIAQTHPLIVAPAASLYCACSSVVVLDKNSGASSSSSSLSTIGSGGAGPGGAFPDTTTVGPGGSSTSSNAATSVSSSGTGGDPTGPDEAVAFQINPGHTGAVENDSLTPPLTMRWSRNLGAQVSYPLIAGGHVFVTTGSNTVTAELIALDQKTGNTAWGPIELGGSHPASYAAYEDGNVFTLNYDGEVRAFEAATGAELWSMHLPSAMGQFNSALTALGGKIYVTGGYGADAVFVVSEATGALLLKKIQPATGGWNQPAVSATDAYFACACAVVCGLDAMSGGDLWPPPQSCVGKGWGPTILSEGWLYVVANIGAPQEEGPVFDALTGGKVGTFQQDATSAFHKGRGFFFSKGILTSKSVPAMVPLWSFAGDGTLSTTPIVVNGHVYMGGTSGTVVAVDEVTGAPVWSQNLGLGEPIDDGGDWQDAPRMGLAAGGGALLVPARHHLAAFW